MLPEKLRKAVNDSMANALETQVSVDNIVITSMMRAKMGGDTTDIEEEVAAYADDLLIFLIMQIEEFR